APAHLPLQVPPQLPSASLLHLPSHTPSHLPDELLPSHVPLQRPPHLPWNSSSQPPRHTPRQSPAQSSLCDATHVPSHFASHRPDTVSGSQLVPLPSGGRFESQSRRQRECSD